MSIPGTFEHEEDPDIVRLHANFSATLSATPERSGWVNVGAFAVRIEIDSAGDARVTLYGCGAEDDRHAFGSITAKRADALARGALDCDAEEPSHADDGEG